MWAQDSFEYEMLAGTCAVSPISPTLHVCPGNAERGGWDLCTVRGHTVTSSRWTPLRDLNSNSAHAAPSVATHGVASPRVEATDRAEALPPEVLTVREELCALATMGVTPERERPPQ